MANDIVHHWCSFLFSAIPSAKYKIKVEVTLIFYPNKFFGNDRETVSCGCVWIKRARHKFVNLCWIKFAKKAVIKRVAYWEKWKEMLLIPRVEQTHKSSEHCIASSRSWPWSVWSGECRQRSRFSLVGNKWRVRSIAPWDRAATCSSRFRYDNYKIWYSCFRSCDLKFISGTRVRREINFATIEAHLFRPGMSYFHGVPRSEEFSDRYLDAVEIQRPWAFKRSHLSNSAEMDGHRLCLYQYYVRSCRYGYILHTQASINTSVVYPSIMMSFNTSRMA